MNGKENLHRKKLTMTTEQAREILKQVRTLDFADKLTSLESYEPALRAFIKNRARRMK